MKKKVKIAYHPGVYLKEELEVRNWSQKQFAELSGLTVEQVRNLIKGKLDITSDLAKSIANTFELQYNFGGIGKIDIIIFLKNIL